MKCFALGNLPTKQVRHHDTRIHISDSAPTRNSAKRFKILSSRDPLLALLWDYCRGRVRCTDISQMFCTCFPKVGISPLSSIKPWELRRWRITSMVSSVSWRCRRVEWEENLGGEVARRWFGTKHIKEMAGW